jgi:hypothetical protein
MSHQLPAVLSTLWNLTCGIPTASGMGVKYSFYKWREGGSERCRLQCVLVSHASFKLSPTWLLKTIRIYDVSLHSQSPGVAQLGPLCWVWQGCSLGAV